MRSGRDRRGVQRGDALRAIFGSSLGLLLTRSSVSASPVASWPDASGNGNAAAQGTGSLQPTLGGSGVAFDGVDDLMTVTDAPSIRATGKLVVGLALTPDVITSNRVPICKSSNTSGSWSVQTNGAACRFHCGTPGVNFGEVASVFAVGTPVRLIWLFDDRGVDNPTRLLCYVNGVQQTVTFTGTIPGTLTSTADNVTIGAYSTPVQFYQGKVREAFLGLGYVTASQIPLIDSHLAGA